MTIMQEKNEKLLKELSNKLKLSTRERNSKEENGDISKRESEKNNKERNVSQEEPHPLTRRPSGSFFSRKKLKGWTSKIEKFFKKKIFPKPNDIKDLIGEIEKIEDENLRHTSRVDLSVEMTQKLGSIFNEHKKAIDELPFIGEYDHFLEQSKGTLNEAVDEIKNATAILKECENDPLTVEAYFPTAYRDEIAALKVKIKNFIFLHAIAVPLKEFQTYDSFLDAKEAKDRINKFIDYFRPFIEYSEFSFIRESFKDQLGSLNKQGKISEESYEEMKAHINDLTIDFTFYEPLNYRN